MKSGRDEFVTQIERRSERRTREDSGTNGLRADTWVDRYQTSAPAFAVDGKAVIIIVSSRTANTSG